MPGGGGLRLKYSNPIYVDDVAADFPEMPIILAHPSFPWQDEAISIAMHKPEVYIDLSGWSPKYFPPQLVHYANTLLKRQVLFGSDYPMITPDRWLRDFEKLEIDDEVRPLVLKENAVRLLGTEEQAARSEPVQRAAAGPRPRRPVREHVADRLRHARLRPRHETLRERFGIESITRCRRPGRRSSRVTTRSTGRSALRWARAAA